MAEAPTYNDPLDAKAEEISALLNSEQVLYRRLKENYEILKCKHRSLQDELTNVHRLFAQCENEKISQRLTHEAEIQKIKKDFTEKIVEVERSSGDTREQFIQFKSLIKCEIGETYATAIRKLHQDVQTLQDKNSELRGENVELESGLQSKQNQNLAVLTKENDTLIKKLQIFDAQNKDNEQRINELKAELRAAHDKIEILNQTEVKLKFTENQNVRLHERCEKRQNDYENSKDASDALCRNYEAKIAEYESENSVLKHTNQQLDLQIDNLQDDVNALQSELLQCKKKNVNYELMLEQNKLDFESHVQAMNNKFGREKKELVEHKQTNEYDPAEPCIPDLIQKPISNGREDPLTENIENRSSSAHEMKELELKYREKELQWVFDIKQEKENNIKLKETIQKLKKKISSLKLDGENLERLQEEMKLRKVELQELTQLTSTSKQENTEFVNENERLKKLLEEKERKMDEQKHHYRTLLKDMKFACEKLKEKYEKLKKQVENSADFGNSVGSFSQSSATKLRKMKSLEHNHRASKDFESKNDMLSSSTD